MSSIGEISALITSFCWSLSALGFTKSTRQLGSIITNRVRVLIALAVLILINGALYAQPVPLHVEGWRWVWLGISGIIGLVLGDSFLFLAYGEIGPRLGLLLLSLTPVFGAAIAWIFFGQALSLLQVAGIIVTLGGICWVVLVRSDPSSTAPYHVTWRGISYGVIAALGQSIGLIFSQQGMNGSFSPISGTLIRLLTATTALWLMTVLQGQAKVTVTSLRDHPSAFGWNIFGALFGPVIGVSTSLLAVQHASIGVASTLMALPPVFMLPISRLVFKEHFGWQAVIGTLVAIAGVAMLFLS